MKLFITGYKSNITNKMYKDVFKMIDALGDYFSHPSNQLDIESLKFYAVDQDYNCYEFDEKMKEFIIESIEDNIQ